MKQPTWEPIWSWNNRELVYWRRRLPDGSWLTVQRLHWAHRGPGHGKDGKAIVHAEGDAPTLAAAKRAAEASLLERAS